MTATIYRWRDLEGQPPAMPRTRRPLTPLAPGRVPWHATSTDRMWSYDTVGDTPRSGWTATYQPTGREMEHTSLAAARAWTADLRTALRELRQLAMHQRNSWPDSPILTGEATAEIAVYDAALAALDVTP